MKIFVGPGNPTSEFAADNWRERFNALVAETFLDGEKIFRLNKFEVTP